MDPHMHSYAAMSRAESPCSYAGPRYHRKPMLPLTRPQLGPAEADACARVLASGMLVQGAEVRAFEDELARAAGRSHALAVASGTAALELALRALEVGPGDDVLCPALTWPSPAHAIRLVGARPVLVDVDLRTWNGTAEAFAAARTPGTRALIAIDQFGAPADHAAIAAALPDVPLVVDGACSLGASLHGRPALAYGVIACTSFHPRKVITTGEGGACFTDEPALAERIAVLRNHGQRRPGEFVSVGPNLRLGELAAAIGRVQLAKLHDFVAERRRLRARFVAALPQLALQLPCAGAEPNGQTLGVLLNVAGAAERDQVVRALGEHGVMAGRLSYALHELPQFSAEAEAARQRGLSHAAELAARGLALPLFPGMGDDGLGAVIDALGRVLPARART
jgi:perosamine synthetase